MNGTALQAADVDIRTLTIDGPAGPLAARVYRAVRHGRELADTLLVFFHGGGFTSGSLAESDPCLRALAGHLDAVLVAPSYAQASEQPFPAAAEDAYAAIADCSAKPRRYRWTGRTLIVAGVEAGGNLAAVAALMARDRGGPPIAGQLLISPMLDPGLTTDSMRTARNAEAGGQIASFCAEGYREYLPRAADRMHPYACPLASTRLKGLPSTLMVSIEGDPLHDEADAYARKLVAAGVPLRSLVLPVASQADAPVDAESRCRAASDDPCFSAMADFVASCSAAPRASTTTAPTPSSAREPRP